MTTKKFNKKNAVHIAAHLIKTIDEQEEIVLEEIYKRGSIHDVIIFRYDLFRKKYRILKFQKSSFDTPIAFKNEGCIDVKDVFQVVWQELLKQKYYVASPKMNSPLNIFSNLTF